MNFSDEDAQSMSAAHRGLALLGITNLLPSKVQPASPEQANERTELWLRSPMLRALRIAALL